MTAEPISATLPSRLSMSGNAIVPRGYYRSKLFTAPYTTNLIVAAAGPLLSLLERLGMSPTLPPVEKVRENIEHELFAFHSRLKSSAQADELQAIAHYLLCATIDELLGKNYLRLYGKPAEFNAFTSASQDAPGPEQRFFDIIAHIKERPDQYLDLLELAYYCLIAGFEGIQHGRSDGRAVLDNLLEELYQLIQLHRVNPAPRLFREPEQKKIIMKNNRPLIIISILSVSLLIAAYVLSHALIEYQAKTLRFAHSVINKENSHG